MKIPIVFLASLKTIISPWDILVDPVSCALYSRDDSRHVGLADMVIFVRNHEDTAAVVKLCYQFKLPLTTRGKGTGTTGGAVPAEGGIVLSLEKMDEMLEFEPADSYIRVQAGVLNQTVQSYVFTVGLFWAPDPGSAANCTVGGNIACNAGGPRAVKYGATRENVLGLMAVTGTGETIHTGGYTTKSAAGYDLTRLLIGSEGTLAIVTEAILKLTPLPPPTESVQLLYRDTDSASRAAVAIMSQPFVPEALEFLDTSAAGLIDIFAGAVLLVKTANITAIKKAAQNTGLLDCQEDDDIWARRKTLSPRLKKLSPHKINEDIVVPVSAVPELLGFIEKLAYQHNILIVNFGHIGNGNIHVNLLTERSPIALQVLQEIFDKVIDLNGTVSGEHGIGFEKVSYLSKYLDKNTMAIMRDIKKVFDPGMILNPGKILI